MSGSMPREERAAYYAALGEELESQRQKAGLTYAEIARQTGLPPSRVRRHFTGQIGYYRVVDMWMYADLLDFKFSDLVRTVEARDTVVKASAA